MKIYGLAVRGLYKLNSGILCMDGYNLFSFNNSVHKYSGSVATDILKHIKRKTCTY